MPSKRRSAPAKPLELSRPALLARYGITDTTLRRLTEKLKLVSLEAFTEHGQVIYQIPEAENAILKMGSVCPWSVRILRAPFLRKLYLNVLTLSDSDAIEDFTSRGIVNKNLTTQYVAGVRKMLQASVSPILSPLINAHKAPKTATESEEYELLLQIMGISGIYQSPASLEDFYFHDQDLLHFLNQVVWSHSAPNDVKTNLITHAVGSQVVSPLGLAQYQYIFHDKGFMRDTDLSWYLSGLSPKVRLAYQESASLSTEEFMVRAKLAQDTITEMQYLSRTLKVRIRELSASSDPIARVEATRLISSLIKVEDHLGKINPGSNKALPDYLREIGQVSYEYDQMFKGEINGAENTG